jgi:uncharacterized protein YndB with AHSA1/START domain
MIKNEYKITRIFNAPREMVFRAWTDPVYVKQWWGPAEFSSPYCTIDFRVGGKFRFCMRSPDGKDYWNVGVYNEIIVPEKIVSTMHFADKDGSIVPSSYYFESSEFPSEMVDVITFEIYGKVKTKLTLCRNHSSDLANKFGEIQGWNQSLDKFSSVVEKSKL